VIREAGKFVHYHISEPMLEPVADGEVDHQRAAELLANIGYAGWVSIEMKLVSDTDVLYRSVTRAASCYVDR
jgi:hydroxypyruvate isomerase